MSSINKKGFIKQLRLNSRKYRNAIIERAGNRCEICDWSALHSNCLQVHHICPVEVYSGVFSFMKEAIIGLEEFSDGLPNERFEMANQVALCPNCHAITHAYIRTVAEHKEDNFFTDLIIDDFLKHIKSEVYSFQKVSKLRAIANGILLKERLDGRKIWEI